MDMTDWQKPNAVAAGGVDQTALLPVSKLTCRWHKASDGALVTHWSLAEETRPALGIVSDNLNSPRPDAVPNKGRGKKAQLINRAKALAEPVAIILLIGIGAFLAVMSFMTQHNDLAFVT
jgi:hypothetical protein